MEGHASEPVHFNVGRAQCSESPNIIEIDFGRPQRLESPSVLEAARDVKAIHVKLDDLIHGQENIARTLVHMSANQSFANHHGADLGRHSGKYSSMLLRRGSDDRPRDTLHSTFNMDTGVSRKDKTSSITSTNAISHTGFYAHPSGSRTKTFPWSQAVNDATKTSKHSLKLRDFSRYDGSETRAKSGFMRLPTVEWSSNGTSDLTTLTFGGLQSTLKQQIVSSLPIMPSSKLALTFDICSMVFLFYDCVMIPYLLAWDIEVDGFFLFMALLVGFFWTLDMFVQFLKSYTQDDQIIMDMREIARHYLRRRFPIDLFILTCDWVGIVMEMAERRQSFSKLAKFVRLLKVSRVLRLISLLQSGRFSQLKEMCIIWAYSWNVPTAVEFVANLLRLVFFIMLFNHLAACLWLALVESSWQDTGSSWQVTISEMHGGRSWMEAGLSQSFIYFFAFYWSISTMFSGSSFLIPLTSLESAFSALYVLLGVLFASSIVSSMAAMLMNSHQTNRDKTEKLKKLRRFLQQQNIDPMTSLMVQRQASERMTVVRKLAEADVDLLTILAPELRERLRIQIWSRVLMEQPLWRACALVDDQLIRNLCKFALQINKFDPGQIIFTVGESLENSYILVWGTMQYTFEETVDDKSHTEDVVDSTTILDMPMENMSFCPMGSEPTDALEDRTSRILISQSQHISEIALWAEWRTVGELETTSHGECIVCSSQAIFEYVAPTNSRAQRIMRNYAKALVEFLDTETPLGLSDLSSAIDYDSIVALMPQDTRVLMSIPCLQALKTKFPDKGKWADLETEIRNGVCNLGSESSGQVLRTVKVVALHLRRHDSRVCVKLGEFVCNEVRVQLDWPGTKMAPRQSLVSAANYLLNEHLPALAPSVHLEHYHLEVNLKTSAAYDLQTKYLRTLVYASCSGLDVTTTTYTWGCQTVECFTSNKEGVGSRAFAWMTHEQYESILALGQEGERLVSEWIAGMFTSHVFRRSGSGGSNDGEVPPQLQWRRMSTSSTFGNRFSLKKEDSGDEHVIQNGGDGDEDTIDEDGQAQFEAGTCTSSRVVQTYTAQKLWI